MEGSCPWLAYGWSDRYCTYIYILALGFVMFRWCLQHLLNNRILLANQMQEQPKLQPFTSTIHFHQFSRSCPLPIHSHPFPAPGAVVSQHAMPAGGGSIAICGGLDGPDRAQGGQHAACLAGFATWSCHPQDPHMEHCGALMSAEGYTNVYAYVYTYIYIRMRVYLFICVLI